jgi:cytochrome c oxidase subunit 1
MFVSGMESWLRVPMMVSTMLIAVPTGIKIFSWLGTMWRGVIQMNTAMLFAIGFIFTFVIGGLSGVMVASVPFDIHVSNTYFIVAHFHYVLFGGSVMTIYAGLYFWYPKMTGRLINERLGRIHFWATFVALNATFMPMHWLGMAACRAASRTTPSGSGSGTCSSRSPPSPSVPRRSSSSTTPSTPGATARLPARTRGGP